MTTIQRYAGNLQHEGSGPNWQEGIITLCTCKHDMRTLLKVNDWRGIWVAGFSTANKQVGRNFLIYLMRFEKAFESHFSLWNELPEKFRQAKAANRDKFGDVYQPLRKDTQEHPFNACSYYQPHQSHSPKYNWPRDINYHRDSEKKQ